MKCDFGLHFAAWFLVSTLVVLGGGFVIKTADLALDPTSSGVVLFCYSFIAILSIALAGALIDVFVVTVLTGHFKTWRQRRALRSVRPA